MEDIQLLNPENFRKCGNIWNMEQQAQLAEQFYTELLSGNRITYVCQREGAYIAEISIVFDSRDSDYTIVGQRVYLSRLIVKPEFRRRGIGTELLEFLIRKARERKYREMTVGVDLDNYPALKLYVRAGFDKILSVGTDAQGQYVKLLKIL